MSRINLTACPRTAYIPIHAEMIRRDNRWLVFVKYAEKALLLEGPMQNGDLREGKKELV